jgi:hypothetical protein
MHNFLVSPLSKHMYLLIVAPLSNLFLIAHNIIIANALSWTFIQPAHWTNCRRVDMSFNSDILLVDGNHYTANVLFNWIYMCWRLLNVITYHITTKVVSSNLAHDVVCSIQHYAIKFVSDLRQVGGFHQVLLFPPPIKLW